MDAFLLFFGSLCFTSGVLLTYLVIDFVQHLKS